MILYGTKEKPHKISGHEPRNTIHDQAYSDHQKQSSSNSTSPGLQLDHKQQQPATDNTNHFYNTHKNFIDWKNMKSINNFNNFPFIQRTFKTTTKSATTTRTSEFGSDLFSYYFIATNKKPYDSYFTDNYSTNDYVNSDEYIDYDHEYDVNSIKPNKGFHTDQVLLAMLSTSRPSALYVNNQNKVTHSELGEEPFISDLQAVQRKNSFVSTPNGGRRISFTYLIFFKLLFIRNFSC